jgi:hypothetical protein
MESAQQPKREPDPDPGLSRAGVIGPLIGFLDRNLLRFSPPVRDTIGIGFLLLIVAYFLNGLIGSTYVRGELWVHRAGDRVRGEGWQVSSGENQAIVNHSGFWTLPIYGNGIPGVIRLTVDDDGRDQNGQRRAPRTLGEVKAYGPFPVWNTFKPMNSLVIDVYLDQAPAPEVKLARNDNAWPFPLDTVYAQSSSDPSQLPATVVTLPSLPCALALKQIRVGKLPGFFRSSGRAYFELLLDGKAVPENLVFYGPGLAGVFGQFPVPGHKELWLPVQTNSNDRYSGIYANLSAAADCEAFAGQKETVAVAARSALSDEQVAQAVQAVIPPRDPSQSAVQSTLGSTDRAHKSMSAGRKSSPPVSAARLTRIPARGKVELVMKSDSNDLLNRFDLSAALAAPGQEVTLSGDPQGRATISVVAVANQANPKVFTVTQEVTSKDRLQKTLLTIGQPARAGGDDEGWRFGYELLERSRPEDFFVSRLRIDVTMQSDRVPAEVRAKAASTAAQGLNSAQVKYLTGQMAAAARAQAGDYVAGKGLKQQEFVDVLLGLFK